MKSKQQKRMEAADRLDAYAVRVECGAKGGYLPENRKAEADKRRAEAQRLRKL